MPDYIIIGAGAAGCVLAARLSENPKTSVLVLEAGPHDRTATVHTPAAFSKLFKSDRDWAYFTEPQPHLNNRRLYWPRGKMLGGSSSMNAMVYIRGNRLDFDRWRDLGNPGWSYAEVLPCFERIRVNVEHLREPNPLSRAFVEAATQAGYAENPDFNGPEQDGFGLYRVNQKGGRRHSAAAAYLRPALRRPNLKVIAGALAAKIIVRDSRAIGVSYTRNGTFQQEAASKEVILCGGAVNSPQLLLLSGIGPAEHLTSLGIPVAADLPGVGENLQDHLAVPVCYQCTQPVSLATAQSPVNVLKYLLFQSGPLTSNVAEAGGFVRTRNGEAPNLQFHFGPVYYVEHGFQNFDGHAFTIGPTLIRPRSRGSIRLRSSDPAEPPLIQPSYLADDADFEVLFDGVKIARRLASSHAFDPYRGVELCPGSLSIEDHIRALTETLYHPVGTCKMGNDAGAVVDAQLRVRGVKALRVADASIMPEIVGGNTQAATLMIAERAADFIAA